MLTWKKKPIKINKTNYVSIPIHIFEQLPASADGRYIFGIELPKKPKKKKKKSTYDPIYFKI